MNLDYMITSEDGTIYSQDPNIGIATRSSVRFNIGMDDDSGGDGRLRTRARYLVPNNPTDVSKL
jgi:hypothetical protein